MYVCVCARVRAQYNVTLKVIFEFIIKWDQFDLLFFLPYRNMDSVHCWNGAKGDQIPTRLDPCQTPFPNWLNWSPAWSTNQKHNRLPPSAKTADKNSPTWRVSSVTRKESTPCKSSIAVNIVGKNLLCSLVCSYTNVLFSSMCQTCMGKPQRGSSCPSCGTESSEDPFYLDNSPYACAPCGQASATSKSCCTTSRPEAVSPPRLSILSSFKCLLASISSKHQLISYHMLFVSQKVPFSCWTSLPHALFHVDVKSNTEKKTVVIVNTLKRRKKVLMSSTSFPCRSCEKSFPKTSLCFIRQERGTPAGDKGEETAADLFEDHQAKAEMWNISMPPLWKRVPAPSDASGAF